MWVTANGHKVLFGEMETSWDNCGDGCPTWWVYTYIHTYIITESWEIYGNGLYLNKDFFKKENLVECYIRQDNQVRPTYVKQNNNLLTYTYTYTRTEQTAPKYLNTLRPSIHYHSPSQWQGNPWISTRSPFSSHIHFLLCAQVPFSFCTNPTL